MNWKANGINEFIADSMEQVKVVYDVVKTMKDNLTHIEETLEGYNRPLLVRKPKPVVKDEFEREHKNMIKSATQRSKMGVSRSTTWLKKQTRSYVPPTPAVIGVLMSIS